MKNISIVNALKSISLLWLGAVIGAGCAFLTQIVLARHLGPYQYGLFASALALVTLITPLGGFGIAGFWLRIFGDEGRRAIRWLKNSLIFVMISTALVLVSLLIWAEAGEDQSSRKILFILSFFLLGQVTVELVSSKLQLEEKFVVLAFWQLLPHLVRLTLIALTVSIFADVINLLSIALMYAGVSVFFLVIGLFQLFNMVSGNFNLKSNESYGALPDVSPNLRNVVSQSWPYGIVGLIYLIYYQSAIIILKHIVGAELAGIYAVAFSILAAVYLFPSVIYQKFLLPKIHRWGSRDLVFNFKVFKTGNILMLMVGVVAALFVVITAAWFIPLLFGTSYVKAIDILYILSVAIPLRFFSSSCGAFLSVGNHIKNKVKIMSLAAIINIILNIVLVPAYKMEGAAVSAVITELFLVISLYFYSRKFIF